MTVKLQKGTYKGKPCTAVVITLKNGRGVCFGFGKK
jgi:hypothetical protein